MEGPAAASAISPVSAIVDEIDRDGILHGDRDPRTASPTKGPCFGCDHVCRAKAIPHLGRKIQESAGHRTVTMKAYTLSSFLEKIAGLVLVTAGFLPPSRHHHGRAWSITVRASVLQERAWELVSLRVLGLYPRRGCGHPVRRVRNRDHAGDSDRPPALLRRHRIYRQISFQRELSDSRRDRDATYFMPRASS